MNLREVKINKKWYTGQLWVVAISEPTETQFDGFVQNITVITEDGRDEFGCYYTDPMFAVDRTKTGPQWYKVRYKNGYLEGNPVDVPENETEADCYLISRSKK